MTTFEASAHYHAKYLGTGNEHDHHPESPTTFRALVWAKDFPEADLDAIAAKFPKFVKVKVSNNSLWFDVHFNADGVNKGANETGIKRLRKFLEIAGPLNWKAQSLNSYKTLEDFLAAV